MPDDLTAMLRGEMPAEGENVECETGIYEPLAEGFWDALAVDLAVAAAGHYESWGGLMSILDRHYPADVPVLCDENSPDLGPRIVALIRHLDAARKSEAEAVSLVETLWTRHGHRQTCPIVTDLGTSAVPRWVCNCGWDEIERRVKAVLARRKEHPVGKAQEVIDGSGT